jgi:hypothetical protein
MRYRNGVPLAIYAVLDLEYGDIVYTSTRLRSAQEKRRHLYDEGWDVVVWTYDQREK